MKKILSVKVNQLILRNSTQKRVMNIPPEQQYRFPILEYSRWEAMSFSLITKFETLSSQCELEQKERCASSHYHGDASSQNFQSKQNSAHYGSNCCCLDRCVFPWTTVAFQSAGFVSKVESQPHTLPSFNGNKLYEEKNNLIVKNIADSENF